MAITQGRFVFHELAPPNRDAASAFYASVIGWTATPSEFSDDYTLLTNDTTVVGGIARPDGDAAGGGPPRWLPYVSVYDLDESMRQVSGLGGRVVLPPREVSGVGCWAVIADPHGAAIGVFEPPDNRTPRAPAPRRGEFSWHELTTSDYKAAFSFYHSLFHWERISEFDMGEMGTYFIFGYGGQSFGGMFNRTAEMPSPNWLSYIRVDDVKAATTRAAANGATVLRGPIEVPGGDWITQALDPQGVPFALHTIAGS